jgi:two-component system response regulator AtoC
MDDDEPRAHRVLIATSNERAARELESTFAELGVAHRTVPSASLAGDEVKTGAYDVAVVDLALSKGGVDLVGELLERAPDVAVVALTSADDPHLGVKAVRQGAADFVRSPLDRDELRYVLGKSLKMVDFADAEPPRSVRAVPRTNLIGTSEAMRELASTTTRVANGIATVLVRGESGSGKELVARRIHEESPRAGGPFVKVHCAALPDNLLESELFGYEKGAFTGAVARKPGRVELAEGGTLFLDEIGDITPAVQVKLLRVLQDREYEPLGGTRTVKADVRFVAATHRDLQALVGKGDFREDLFYRLNVVSLWVPPLRARAEDIERLAVHFCQTVGAANGRGSIGLDVRALDLLKRQSWPGNVRELQNFIERLVVLSSGPRISVADVERELKRPAGPLGLALATGNAPAAKEESSVIALDAAVMKAERRALEKALRSAGGNRAVAARLLGISVRSLYYKLEQHQIT